MQAVKSENGRPKWQFEALCADITTKELAESRDLSPGECCCGARHLSRVFRSWGNVCCGPCRSLFLPPPVQTAIPFFTCQQIASIWPLLHVTEVFGIYDLIPIQPLVFSPRSPTDMCSAVVREAEFRLFLSGSSPIPSLLPPTPTSSSREALQRVLNWLNAPNNGQHGC